MSAQLFFPPFATVFSSSGVPVPGALEYFYKTNTNVLAPVYFDAAMTSAAPNPMKADLAGRFPPLYLDTSVTYRVHLTDPLGVPLGNDVDPYIPGTTGIGIKGDPGSNGNSVGPFSAIGQISIATGTNTAFVDDGGRIIADTTLTDTDVANYPLAIAKTTNGRYFRRDINSLNVLQFGCTGKALPGVVDDLPKFVAANAYAQRFAVNPAGGVLRGLPPIKVPAGSYYWGSTWEQRGGAFIFEGVGSGKGPAISLIIVAANTTALIVERYDTYGPSGPSGAITFGNEGEVIRGLSFQSLGGTDQTKHGVILRGRITFDNNQVSQFPGHGLFAVAAAGSSDFQGNDNNLTITNNSFVSNGLCGAVVGGPDANAGVILGNDFSSNGSFGLADTSFLGNFVAGNHASANGVAGSGLAQTGSSIVFYAGQPWFVMPGQAAAAKTTTPGSNPAVWGALPGGGGQLPGYPTWVSGINVFEGGPYAFTSINNGNTVIGNYAEGSQAPVQVARGVVLIGNNFSQAVGVVRANPAYPICNITSNMGAVDNPGGFNSMNGTMTVSMNFNGYVSETYTPELPAGVQLKRSTTGLQWVYNNASAYYTINGPNSPRPLRFEMPGKVSLTGLTPYASVSAAMSDSNLLSGDAYLVNGQVMVRP